MLTDSIAKMIEEMLNEANGTLELQRNELAGRLGCVPSQISYVIASRFTPERGYMIESARRWRLHSDNSQAARKKRIYDALFLRRWKFH